MKLTTPNCQITLTRFSWVRIPSQIHCSFETPTCCFSCLRHATELTWQLTPKPTQSPDCGPKTHLRCQITPGPWSLITPVNSKECTQDSKMPGWKEQSPDTNTSWYTPAAAAWRTGPSQASATSRTRNRSWYSRRSTQLLAISTLCRCRSRSFQASWWSRSKPATRFWPTRTRKRPPPLQTQVRCGQTLDREPGKGWLSAFSRHLGCL